MRAKSTVIVLAAVTLGACGRGAEPAKAPAEPAAVESAPVVPPPPGAPGGLPDDRTPLSEGRIDPKSAQGAGQVVQTYFALIEAGDFAGAFALREPDPRLSQAHFTAELSAYAQHHAQIGAPGPIEGAAGSLYVDIPVVIYGRLKTGEAVHQNGTVTLRRVNDVPGSTPAQRRWRIFRLDLE